MGDAPRRRDRETKFLLRDQALPDQGELQVITNAMHAALEYSPLKSAPKGEGGVYAHVAAEIERRFWSDVYVERPEILDILFTLDTGQLALITGERGSGKSTALHAVINRFKALDEEEHDDGGPAGKVVPQLFDAGQFSNELTDASSASETIQREFFLGLDAAIAEREGWLAFLHQRHPAYAQLRLALDREGLTPQTHDQWRYLVSEGDYGRHLDQGDERFTACPFADRLRHLLLFIGEHTDNQPLLIIDNLDHLSDEIAASCGVVLANILLASPHHTRGAIAIREENVDALHTHLGIAIRPRQIPMMTRSLAPDSYEKPPIDITLEFLERRFAILKEPETVQKMREAIDSEKVKRLAERLDQGGVSSFFDALMTLIDEMIYDIFRTDEPDERLRSDNWEFARAIHSWHNGSLRECGLSLTMFAFDISRTRRICMGCASSSTPCGKPASGVRFAGS